MAERETIDIFSLPKDEAATFKINREICAKEVIALMKAYCREVKRETLDPAEGEIVVGYFYNGQILMTIGLDPFEVSAMMVARERGKLKEYILAANELDEADILQALEEAEEKENI